MRLMKKFKFLLDKSAICGRIHIVADAALAHPVERHLAKVEVASSSLVSRSTRTYCSCSRFFPYAPVMELVDMRDLGSRASGVGVRVPSGAPKQYNPNLFPIGEGFGLFVYFDRYEQQYFTNGVRKKPTSKPRGPRKKKVQK